eukprot:PhF_6_TR25802/c0_g1_i1/m.36409
MIGQWVFVDSDAWVVLTSHKKELGKILSIHNNNNSKPYSSKGVDSPPRHHRHIGDDNAEDGGSNSVSCTIQSQYGYTMTRSLSNASQGVKLIIFDMNGVMVNRKNKASVVSRPGLVPFLQSMGSQFALGVWTSAMAHNAKKALEAVLPPEIMSMFILVLTRDDCKPAPTPEDKYATEKNLEKVWANPSLYGVWGPHNTILVDDTPSKGSSCPQNILVVPTFDRKDKVSDDVFRELGRFLMEEVRGAEDVREAVKKWVCPVKPSSSPESIQTLEKPRKWWPSESTFFNELNPLQQQQAN